MPQSTMGILAPLTKILPKSYDFSPWGPYTSLTAVSPVISHGKRTPVGSLSAAGALVGQLCGETAVQPCYGYGPRRACRSSRATSYPSVGGTRRARAVRERDRLVAGAAGLHSAHTGREACWITRGNRGRGEAHQCMDRGQRPRYLFLTYREKGKRHVASGSPQTRSRTPSVLVWDQDEDVNYCRPDRSRQCTPSQ
jgi:hypothetical protein